LNLETNHLKLKRKEKKQINAQSNSEAI
jgi:hypothetical protein